MKLKFLFLIVLMMTVVLVKAQKSDSVTREEMTRYVVMMDSVNTWKRRMSETNLRLAQGNSKITAARYTALLPLVDDQKKLTEAKATPDEIAYVKKAMETRNKNAQNFSAVFTSLMSKTGEATYRKVSKAVESNPKVRERFNTELNALSEKTSGGQ